MKILESQSAVLTNYEVLTHLLELDAEYSGADGEGRARKKPENLKIIMKDTLTYLRRPNAPLTDPYNASALTSSSSLFARLAPKYRITKAEYVMLFNLRPKNLAELEVIIEEASTRFGEEELMEILQSVIASVNLSPTSVPVSGGGLRCKTCASSPHTAPRNAS